MGWVNQMGLASLRDSYRSFVICVMPPKLDCRIVVITLVTCVSGPVMVGEDAENLKLFPVALFYLQDFHNVRFCLVPRN